MQLSTEPVGRPVVNNWHSDKTEPSHTTGPQSVKKFPINLIAMPHNPYLSSFRIRIFLFTLS